MESLPLERIGLSNISNKPISSPLHLGMTEKSLFTEVIIFENSHIRIRTLICVRGSNTALPLSYTASNYTVVRKNLLWKRFLSEFRRKLPFGFEPKTCWFVINCSIHLSYGSISRFLYFDSGWGSPKKIFIWEPWNSEIADAGVEPTISRSWLLRGIPFHSSANAVWRIRTSKSFPTD